MRLCRLFTLVGLSAALVASQAQAGTPGDPFEHLNRRLFASAESANKRYVAPIGRIYQAVTPGPIGVGLHNFFTWLSEPAVVVNDLLQARVNRAANDLARLVTNATFAGFVDLAQHTGLPHHDNDFGITLGRWGVGPGPYIFLPFVGPSTVRDAIGVGADAAMSPLYYIRFPGRLTLSYSTTVVGGIDGISHSQGDLDAATASADDPYATLRSLYLQSREAAIRGDTAAPALPPLDDPAPSSGPASGPSARAAPTAAPAGLAAAPTPMIAPPPAALAQAALRASDDPDAAIATAQPCDRPGAAMGA